MLGNTKKKASSADDAVYRVYIISPLQADTPKEVEQNRAAALHYETRACRKLEDIMSDEKHTRLLAYALHGYIDMLLDDRLEPERRIIEQFSESVIRICDAIAIGGVTITAEMQDDLHSAIATHNLPILLIGDGKRPLSAGERERLFSAVRICTDAEEMHAYDISNSKADTVWRMTNSRKGSQTEMMNNAGAAKLLLSARKGETDE